MCSREAETEGSVRVRGMERVKDESGDGDCCLGIMMQRYQACSIYHQTRTGEWYLA